MPAAVPALGYMVMLFAAFVGYIVARGMLATWTHSIGWLLTWLSVHARIPVKIPFRRTMHIDFGRPFRSANAAVLAALQTWATGAEIEMGYALHGLAQIWDWTVQASEAFAREDERFSAWLVHQFVPKHVARRTAPIAREAKKADNRARDAQASTANLAHVKPHVDRRTGARVTPKPNHLAKRVADTEHELDAVRHRVAQLAGAIAVPHPHAIPRVSDVWRGLTRKAARLERRLGKVEALIGATTLAAAMARVLGLSTRCLGRGGKVGRLARRVCGLDNSLFDSLLLDLIAITSVVSVVEFANDLRAVEDEALGVLGRIVREFPG